MEVLKHLPHPVKQGLKYTYALVPIRLRSGRVFRETCDLLRGSQHWTRAELDDYQMRELKKLLEHCHENVPYYRRLFDEHGLKPEEVRSTSDLEGIPFLTRDLVRENFEDLKATNFPEDAFIRASTGGSSGIPLGFLRQKGYSDEREEAFFAVLWERAGFRYGKDKRVILRGLVVHEQERMRYKPVSRELICSPYWMDGEHLRSYYEEMSRRKIRYIHGHVGSVCTFAQFLLEEGLAHDLQAVLGGSEIVYPFQRKLVRDAFGARMFSWYGHSERVVLAGECECSEHYHIFPEYGVTELIDEEGERITETGKDGEIVGTSFNNYAMPFIRYRTGDISRYAPGPCRCGREYALLDGIEGRDYEYIHTRDGRKISLTGLIFGQYFVSFERIRKMQLRQDKRGEIEIRIVKTPGYSKDDESLIASIIQEAVGSGLELDFRYVDDIPPTKSGKHKFLIQELRT